MLFERSSCPRSLCDDALESSRVEQYQKRFRTPPAPFDPLYPWPPLRGGRWPAYGGVRYTDPNDSTITGPQLCFTDRGVWTRRRRPPAPGRVFRSTYHLRRG